MRKGANTISFHQASKCRLPSVHPLDNRLRHIHCTHTVCMLATCSQLALQSGELHRNPVCACCLPAQDWHHVRAACVQTQPQEWSDQETLLLLEGLELHKDRWADIADHVGTKSQVQCILHFLQLPIEDEFLDELEDKGRKMQGVQGPSQQTDNNSQERTPSSDLIPFADTGNPILSQVILPSQRCMRVLQLSSGPCDWMT